MCLRYLMGATVSLALTAEAAPDWMDQALQHAEQGLQSAASFPGYASLCDLEATIRNVNAPRSGRDPSRGSAPRSATGDRSRPAREPIPPMQVFDNLFFLGNHSVTAWLYGTPEGYLLIDGLNNDQEAETDILGGMRTLGLDPGQIKHVLVTHAHGDHYGGADFIADALGIDILMSQPDWDLAASTPPHPRFGPAPRSGKAVIDGQVLRFGESEISLHLTPGHTPGTLSLIFEVLDHGRQHQAMLWGGTGFNFGPNPVIFREYAASAEKMRRLSHQAGVDVFLSNHVRRDQADVLMKALAQREPGGPHPFVFGESGYELFTVLEQCALAQAVRFGVH
jgi:metallo-beta-lactamase class B